MREVVGWVLLIIAVILLFVGGINWKEIDTLILWLGLLLAGAIMTGGRK